MRKTLDILNKIIYIVLLAVSFWFGYNILKINIIPTKYLLIGFFIYFVVLIVLAIITLIKKIHFIFKFFSTILSVLIITFMFIINNYIDNTDDFLDGIIEKDYVYQNYYMFTLTENKDKDISSFQSIGIYNGDEIYSKAIDELKGKYQLNYNIYDNFIVLKDALLNKEEEIILVSESDKGLILDIIDESSISILSTIPIKIENETILEPAKVTNEPFNIFISGIDASGDITTRSRSDVNMIVTVNPDTKEILLTSIPRDYYVQLHGTTGYKDKLTHAGVYGIDKSVKTIEDLLDIKIDYYVKVNFSTVIGLVDIIGGIDVNADKTFTTLHYKCKVLEGMNHFDGKCALGYARERYAYKTGDNHRVQNQQDVLMAVFNKVANSKETLLKYNEILKVLGNTIQTNMPKEMIYQLVNNQLNKMEKWTFSSYALKGTGSMDYTYSYSAGRLYVMIPDMNTVNEAKTKIDELLNK